MIELVGDQTETLDVVFAEPFFHGNALDILFHIQDPEQAPGTYLNLAGSRWTFGLTKRGSSTLLLEKDSSVVGQFVVTGTGALLSIRHSDYTNIPATKAKYYWDVQVELADGRRLAVARCKELEILVPASNFTP